MANLFKLSSLPYLPILLVVVGLVLIYLWARSRTTREGFEDTVEPSASNPWKFNMYYVDWCPHCHHAKPEFEKLGSTMTIGGQQVACNAIEAEKNPEAVQGLKISGYPTFVLYDAEGNMVKDFDGPRKTASFRSFLEDTVNMKAQRLSK
jgi:thioredoxin-like negative regulator of GroEL